MGEIGNRWFGGDRYKGEYATGSTYEGHTRPAGRITRRLARPVIAAAKHGVGVDMGLNTDEMSNSELRTAISDVVDRLDNSDKRVVQLEIPVVMDKATYGRGQGPVELGRDHQRTGYLRLSIGRVGTALLIFNITRSYNRKSWHSFAVCNTRWANRSIPDNKFEHAVHQMVEQHSSWTTNGSRYKPSEEEALKTGRPIQWSV